MDAAQGRDRRGTLQGRPGWQDEFVLLSRQRTAADQIAGGFDTESVPWTT
ncbi:hypothetical protein Rhow_001159 [Rhodococcus wratislaviensis]|uniref:Uncharacterized protein n=1 Tax=Rhodococcus wratislaviensis TaxID=44752 RepID=A0A402C3I2_RHOWR|nr:hypothetical protein Rhow_001159 [Rhodococcus wratislaviensis]